VYIYQQLAPGVFVLPCLISSACMRESILCGCVFGSGAAQQALSVSSKLAIHLFYWENDKYGRARGKQRNRRAALLPLDYTKATAPKKHRTFCECVRAGNL
jgi:hypothetical protein